jgi:uncharacterized cupredoxin-like copper-binding protein
MRLICLQAVLLTAPLMSGAPLAYAHGDPKPAEATAAAEQTEWGIAGRLAEVSRTITLDMTDAMRFVPDALTVQEGDTVRFVVRNRGRMLHEMVIGTPDELARHAALMAKFPGMEHDAPYLAHIGPGQSGEIVWHFNRPGSFEFACLIAGHYEAGMRGTLTVVPRIGAEK